MANVQLPSVNQGETDLKAQVKQLLNAYVMLNEELTFLLNNLDTRNVTELNAEKLVAGSIQTEKLAAGSITTETLAAGAVVADKIDVGELSAISANLGMITAGIIESIEIFGSYIATQKDAFPRSEMSASNNLFGAYYSEGTGISIEADYGNAPALNFIVGGDVIANMNMLLGFEVLAPAGMRFFTPSGGIEVQMAGAMTFTSFRKIFDQELGSSLHTQLGDLSDRIEALEEAIRRP